MKRLGYTRFVAQGGDWGAIVTDAMALRAPPELLAIHTNMPATASTDASKALQAGDPPPSGLSPDERRAYEQPALTYNQVAYANMMATRPQTCVVLYVDAGGVTSDAGLARDSTARLSAWMVGNP